MKRPVAGASLALCVALGALGALGAVPGFGAGAADPSPRTVDDALALLPSDSGKREAWRDAFAEELRRRVAAEGLPAGAIAMVLRSVETGLLHDDASLAADAVVRAGLAIDSARRRGTLANRAVLRSRSAIEGMQRGNVSAADRRALRDTAERPSLPPNDAPSSEEPPANAPSPPNSPPPAKDQAPDPVELSNQPWPATPEGFFDLFIGLPATARQQLLQRLHELHMQHVVDLIRDRLLDQLDAVNDPDPSSPDGHDV